ncbi:alpha/beta fold hydrolase [Aspergillus undulatus]|uniref:alpha/beta fold hydrolase n=1 Tax=Aspergillus undulatus TaxID=1810928 RepID=UPI003CCDDAE0
MAEYEYKHIRLATKPTAQLSYTFHPPTTKDVPPALVVFLNGLGLPQASWFPTIGKLKEQNRELPALLTYDRFGQGQTTDRDPDDKDAEDPSHGHDCLAVVRDLRQLITQVVSGSLGVPGTDINNVSLIFVANSIGCAIARLYAQEYPRTVAALLILDSVLANSDFVSIFPDPDVESFDPSTLPPGISPDDLRSEREGIRRIFHPSVGSKEGLSRRNLSDLLPLSDGPILLGSNSRGPLVTVAGHDFEAFVEESARMGRKRELTMAYANPYWERYNEGLVRITEEGRGKGPLRAPGAGHFIQKDNADFVVEELVEILANLG